ncbi:MAG: tetratricopeptide repeat protein [Mariprofundus sp.]|nr:tetratricopeptide repeat protein [Mariprofundus sp.]
MQWIKCNSMMGSWVVAALFCAGNAYAVEQSRNIMVFDSALGFMQQQGRIDLAMADVPEGTAYAGDVLNSEAATVVQGAAVEKYLPHASQDVNIEKAKSAYKQGDLEQALSILQAIYTAAPESSEVNYYLGLVYKGMLDFKKAEIHLQAVAVKNEKNGDAHSHLGEVYHSQGQMDKAKRELLQAQKYHGRPAYTAYLLGLIYLQEKQFDLALSSLQKAIDLDVSFRQKGEYSKGVAYFKQGERAHAEHSFQIAIDEDPDTDAGVYAQLSLIKMKKEAGKSVQPFRAGARYVFSYDDNVVLSPSLLLVPVVIAQKSDVRHTLSLSASYVAQLSDHWKLDSGYQLSQSFHRNIHRYNVTSHTLSVNPTYTMASGDELGLQFSGDYYLLAGTRYLQALGGYLVNRHPFNKRSFGTLRAGFRSYNYFDKVAATENRDGTGLLASYDYLHLLGEGGYATVGLSYARDLTKGVNWTNDQKKINGLISYPLYGKISAEAYGSYVLQHFMNANTAAGFHRIDKVYNSSLALTYVANKMWRLSSQYSWTRALSNIYVYDYTRNIYSLSAEYSY